MGGHSKKTGRGGGGGGGQHGRNCNPEQRKKLSKDPGVPTADLRRAGERLAKQTDNKRRRLDPSVVPSFQNTGRKFGASASSGLSFMSSASSANTPRSEEGVEEETEEMIAAKRRREMATFALQAAKRQNEYDAPQALLHGSDPRSLTSSSNEEDYFSRKGQDVSLRRFFKEFQHVVNSSDVLLEVLDARDPLGCRLESMEHAISGMFGDRKTIVLLLNKTDLVPQDVCDSWVQYLSSTLQLHVLPFTTKVDHKSRACIAQLYALLRRLAAGEGGARKSITVGLIGYPNVGKSSVINALKRKNVVGVGNVPGFTTGNTEVELRSDIRVLDCPGVVTPGQDAEDVVLRNAVRVDQLVNPLVAVERLLLRCDIDELASMYGIGTFDDAVSFVRLVAQRRGRVRQNGEVDEDDAARMVLKDWNDGRLGYYTLPPSVEAIPFSRSGDQKSDEDDDGGPKLLKVAAGESWGAQRLPTFHLSGAGGFGSKKRTRHAEEEDANEEGEELSDNESSDEEITTTTSRKQNAQSRRKRY